MKRILLAVFAVFACLNAKAVIPGYGPLYGRNTLYSYAEYNCSTKDSKDQFFLNYFEYGLTDWVAGTLSTVNYPDGSYRDLSLGGTFQIVNFEWLSLRGSAAYDFGNRAPNDKADSMSYGLTGSGSIWKGLGYIYQVQYSHPCHGEMPKPDWYQQVYLTYAVTESLTPYVSLTTDLCHVDETTDFSVGGWYTIFRDRFGLQWASLYFDVANLTEKYEGLRISVGFDILF